MGAGTGMTKISAPANNIASLTGAMVASTLVTKHETQCKCSTLAAKPQLPRLAPTGRSGSCLPSAFMRTVGEPDERSRMKTAPTIGVVGTYTQGWRGVRSLVRPQGDTQTRTDDAEATVSPVNPSYLDRGTGGEFASLWSSG
jgi:hypothetical protein